MALTLPILDEGKLIDIGMDANDLVVGESIVLSCYVESSPPAHVQLFKDNFIIKQQKLVFHVFICLVLICHSVPLHLNREM